MAGSHPPPLTGSDFFVQDGGGDMDDIAEYIFQVSPTHPFLSPELLNIRVVAGRIPMQNPC